MRRPLLVPLLAGLLLTGCNGGKPAAPSGPTVRVAIGDPAKTDDAARVLQARMAAMGFADARMTKVRGLVSFGVPRTLTADETAALDATGHLTVRPVIATKPVLLCGLADGADSQQATGCDADKKVAYAMAPAEMTERDVASAKAESQPGSGQWAVSLTMRDATAWRTFTAKQLLHRIAFVLDGVVRSAPTIQEAIPDGSATITGSFTEAEARTIATELSGGALPCDVSVSQT